MAQPSTSNEVKAPNPNWKIDKFRKYLEKCGKFSYKVMWSQSWVPGRAYYNGGLQGRVFKNEASAITFALQKRLLKRTQVWLFKWVDNRWEDYNENK